MSTPYTGNDGIFSFMCADSRVNALLVGAKWQSPVLSYSFITPLSTFSTSDINGYGPSTNTAKEPWNPNRSSFSPTVEQAATSALAKWAAVANLTFTQAPDAMDICGDIRFGFTDVGNAQAAAYSPSLAAGGDVWFNYLERSRSFAEGTYNYLTLVHEIGHALGLKHPFSASSSNFQVLPRSLESQSLTIMSYSAITADQPNSSTTDFSYRPTTPMPLDIQAIQHLYGANWSYNAGNTDYVFRQAELYHQTIWDGGGRDTIVYSGLDACVIDLRQGAGSTLGAPVYVVDFFGNRLGTVNNVWIAMGAVIEGATGAGGSDRITGNDIGNTLLAYGGNDILQGGAGTDRIDGGDGADSVVFSGAAADYTVTFNGVTGRYTVGDDHRARDGFDVVSGVENFQFVDGSRAAAQLTISTAVTGGVRDVLGLSEGLFGSAPGAAVFSAALQAVSSYGASAVAIGVASGYASSDKAALASTILSNFGITPDALGGGAPDVAYAALLNAARSVFEVYSDAIGQVVLNISNALQNLEDNEVYGVAAAAFNNRLAGDFDTLSVSLAGVAPPEVASA